MEVLAHINPITDICGKLSASADLTVNFLDSQLGEDGSFGESITDIACYFKAPMMFLAAGKEEAAKRCLSYITKHFFYPNNDFKVSGNSKSSNPVYSEYWSYINGWIIRAANQLGMQELSSWGIKYFNQFDMGQGIFLTQELSVTPRMTDVLTIAHHGLVNLEMGEIDNAFMAGSFLCDAFKKQPDLSSGFYLRFDCDGRIIKNYNFDKKPFYFVSSQEPNQLHFMIGYPAAFLAILYKHTNNLDFLNAARAYLDFSLACHANVYTCDFSHKLAWAASHLYECTRDPYYLPIIERITDYFRREQGNHLWFEGDDLRSYDQSAEIACWFLDIVKNLRNAL